MESAEGLVRIAWSGRDIVLRSPASQSLDLGGTGEKLLSWEPENKEAIDIEVRARIVGTSATVAQTPIVRWWTETGHGNSVWREPTPFDVTSAVRMRNWSLPGRGIVFRIAARQFRIGFQGDGIAGNPAAVIRNTIHVSIQPTYTAPCGCPYTSSDLVPIGEVHAFPMTAREWQLMTADGQPVTGGVPDVEFIAVSGRVVATMQQQDYSDWRPIPHDAAGYRLTDVGAYAAFR